MTLRKEVIVACEHAEGEYIPPICVRPKKENKLRMILNLKNLNGSVENHHFEIETLKHVVALVVPNCCFFLFFFPSFFVFIGSSGRLLLSPH